MTGGVVVVGVGRLRLVGFDGMVGLDGVVGVSAVVCGGDGVGVVRAGVAVDVQPAAARAANAPATTYAAGFTTPL